MNDWILNNWQIIIGVVATPLAWVLGGHKKQNVELKGVEIDNEVKDIDYASKIHELYEKILLRKDADISNITEQLKNTIEDAKEDRDYFRSEINPLREEVQKLRKEVESVNFRNGILTEAADSWEKKFNELQKEHDLLKKQFETYKKNNK